MILVSVSDPILRIALERCARPDEPVVNDEGWVQMALEHGHARVHVRDDRPSGFRELRGARVPEVYLSSERLWEWEQARRKLEVPLPRTEHLARCVGLAVSEVALEGTWVDRLLAEFARGSGAALPLPFRAFTRHALELPCRYTDLREISAAAGLSRGALKARFRRRGLESPFTYLRWLRTLAVAEALASPDATVASAASALGFTSDTNMCRMVKALTGATPGGLRDPGARRRLRVVFVRRHLAGGALAGWSGLDRLFRAGKAA